MPVLAPTFFLFVYWILPKFIYKIYSRFIPSNQKTYITICTLFTVCYVSYSLFNVIFSFSSTFYDILSVNSSVSDADLKRAFRKLSLTYHPDKAGDADAFIRLKSAYDVLSTPSSRFAYNVFGPDVAMWNSITTKEYIRHGLVSSAAYYAVSLFISVNLGVVGMASWGKFWRYQTLVSLGFVELFMITRPLQLPLFLPFQWIILLREAFSLFAVAMTQLGPLLIPEKPDTTQDLLNEIDLNVCSLMEFETSGLPREELRKLVSEEMLKRWAIKDMQRC